MVASGYHWAINPSMPPPRSRNGRWRRDIKLPARPRRGCSGGVEAEPASISGPTLGTRTTGVDHLREGSMSKALAKENVKQPRGSKLDAKKRGQCSLRDLLGIVSEISDL